VGVEAGCVSDWTAAVGATGVDCGLQEAAASVIKASNGKAADLMMISFGTDQANRGCRPEWRGGNRRLFYHPAKEFPLKKRMSAEDGLFLRIGSIFRDESRIIAGIQTI
jgi:hypothetical protein